MRVRRKALIAIFVATAAAAATFAQSGNGNPKFHAELERLMALATKNRAAQKVSAEIEWDEPFANSKVTIQKVAPGGSLAVTVPGNFPAGTVMLSERDAVTLSATTMSAKSYSGRMTVATDVWPGFARLYAMTPLGSSSYSYMPVAFIEAVYNLDLKSPDGTVVKIRPREKIFTIDAQQMNARVKYQAEFYKPNETKPFDTLNGEQSFNSGKDDSVRFEISFGDSVDSPQAEIERISTKMSDTKITEAERNALMERMMKVQMQMIEEMSKGLQTDPASLNKKQDDFGCGLMQLSSTGAPGGVQGQFMCGKNYHGGNLRVAGTMTIAK